VGVRNHCEDVVDGLPVAAAAVAIVVAAAVTAVVAKGRG
jgi:hypothetical protein